MPVVALCLFCVGVEGAGCFDMGLEQLLSKAAVFHLLLNAMACLVLLENKEVSETLV